MTLDTLHNRFSILNRRKVEKQKKKIKASPIVVHDGVEAMSDGQYCAVSELSPNGLLYQFISFQVHRGRGFIQNQEFTVT